MYVELTSDALFNFAALLKVEARFSTATDPKLTKPLREQWDAIFGPQRAPNAEPEAPDPAQDAQDEPAEDKPFGFGAFRNERTGDARKVPRTMPPGNDPRERSEGDSDVWGRLGRPSSSFARRID